jgi:hypothetical protein
METLQDSRGEFTSEGIPDAILFIASFDDLLSVDDLSRRQAAGT